ncbi:hypothetical protein EU800_16755 [Tropicimonas sp. IMCC6043]|nr:hypothetical protein EU800_16755 [Tropicimonas sp. IMCC6043]
MFDIMKELAADRATLLILEIQSDFSGADLAEHSRRVGLAGKGMSGAVMEAFLRTLRRDFVEDSDRVGDAGFVHLDVDRQAADPDENAMALAAFLSIPLKTAREIAAMRLFGD